MKRHIDLEFTYPHPVENVWTALTDAEALSAWFMQTDLVPEVGYEFTFRTDPAPGFDGIIRCRILEVDPPHQLRFTWKGGPVDTQVTWSLATVDGGTRFRVEQTGFSGWRAVLVSKMLQSGSKALYGKNLSQHLDDGSGAATADCMDRSTRFWASLSTLFVSTTEDPRRPA